jgi:geranylgeranyl diphosphate synthase type II
MIHTGVQEAVIGETEKLSYSIDFRDEVLHVRRLIDGRLDELVPPSTHHPRALHESIRYSLLAPGKRIRPVLAVLFCKYLGENEREVLDPACAIEMIHTASLILDDMPSMDDASLRRGRPTNHLVFGEDTATLASVALLNRAFGVVSEAAGLTAAVRIELTRLLSEAIGSKGVIAGQFRDLRPNGENGDITQLIEMYGQKTGALFVASVEAGARVARVSKTWLDTIREFAMNLGLAFQILDDLLDTVATENESGKNVGQDEDKVTFVSVLGPDKSRIEAGRYIKTAFWSLEPLGETGKPLIGLVRSMMEPAIGMALHL